jgi:lipopolysaccharide export LptBFGC system permease protein LptF
MKNTKKPHWSESLAFLLLFAVFGYAMFCLGMGNVHTKQYVISVLFFGAAGLAWYFGLVVLKDMILNWLRK